MSYNEETEADTRAERIEPILRASGWGVVDGSRISREAICPGRIQIGGARGSPLSADYVLFYKGHKLAVVEAKRAGLSYRDGVGQAKDYAERLKSRFAYATNGIKWYEIDMDTGDEGDINLPFPTPDQLWNRTFVDRNDWRERFGRINFETDGGKWESRYYQHNAITAALEAIAKGRKRILLTLATGTGKTSIAFQIAWKLFHSSWSLSGEPSRRPRVLFLADRNILADQAYNAFSAFPNDAITRIDPESIRRRQGVSQNASVFFTIFQTFMTGEGEPVYIGYSRDFFDFIIIDECHRGGARDESAWKGILEYFSPAVQLGLTATPKRGHNADTYSYFGEPVYTYALHDGVEDGYLTPFKVRQMTSTIDDYVYDLNDTVVMGEVEPGDEFTETDFNRKIIIRERELSRVKEFMSQLDQSQKTIVFCVNQRHAALVRDLINQVKESSDINYCHRVTALDGAVGEQHLRNFQDNEKAIPTILTTSHKLSTGVDARNIRHIVLMRQIHSMIEFKQIIGRGTRTYGGKDFFTIWDFVKAHENFGDPEWDGEPEEPVMLSSLTGDPTNNTGDSNGDDEPPEKIEITLADGKVRSIRYTASTTYFSPEGRPVSVENFLKRLFGDLSNLITDEGQLREVWSNPQSRERFLDQLSNLGYNQDRLNDIRKMADTPNSDLFDVLGYILFTLAPQTRLERAGRLRENGLVDIEGELKDLLFDILDAYELYGESELASTKLSQYLMAKYGSVSESRALLGSHSLVRDAYNRMQTELYAV